MAAVGAAAGDPREILGEPGFGLQRFDGIELAPEALVVEERMDHAVAIEADRFGLFAALALGNQVVVGHGRHFAFAQRANMLGWLRNHGREVWPIAWGEASSVRAPRESCQPFEVSHRHQPSDQVMYEP